MVTRIVLLASAIVVLVAAPASAGGWAVSTLDQPPGHLVVGQALPVGFTIRQHGQTPVNPNEGEIGLRLESAGQGSVTFPAVPDGAVGHFVATVRIPAAGTWSWEVLQGWFGPQPLGSIVAVGAGAASASTAAASATATLSGGEGGGQAEPTANHPSSARHVEWWRLAAMGLAGLFAVVFLAELLVGRLPDHDGDPPLAAGAR